MGSTFFQANYFFFLLCLQLGLYMPLSAQQQLKVNLQEPMKGVHELSPDAKYYVGAHLKGVYLWDVQTGRTLKSHSVHIGIATDFAFHPSEPVVVSVGSIQYPGDPVVVAWNYVKDELRIIENGQNQKLVAFHPSGEFFLTVSDAGTIQKWDFKTGKLLAKKEHFVSKMGFSEEGSVFYTFMNSKITVFRSSDLEALHTFTYNLSSASLAFSVDNAHLIVHKPNMFHVTPLDGSATVIANGEWSDRLKKDAKGYLITPSGVRYQLRSKNGTPLPKLPELQTTTTSMGELASVYDVDLSKDGKHLLITTKTGAAIFDFTTTRLKRLDSLTTETWRYGRFLGNDLLFTSKNAVVIYDDERSQIKKATTLELDISDISLSPDHSSMLIVSAEFLSQEARHAGYGINTFDLVKYVKEAGDLYSLSLSSMATSSIPIADSIKKTWTAPPYKVRHSPDGSTVGISVFERQDYNNQASVAQFYSTKNWKQLSSSMKTIVSVQLNGTQKVESRVPKQRFMGFTSAFAVSPKNTSAISGSLRGVVDLLPLSPKNTRLYQLDNSPDRKSTAIYDLAFLPNNDSLYVAVDNSGWVVLRNANSKKNLKTWQAHQNSIFKVLFQHNGKHLITVSGDNTIKIWETLSGKLVTELFIYKNLIDFAVVTNENYYRITKSGTSNIHFVDGLKPYLFYQFDALYNRPDLVLEKLGVAEKSTVNLFHKAWEKRVLKLGFKPEDLIVGTNREAPIVQLKGLQSVNFKSSSSTIMVEGTASDAYYPVDRLFIEINGVPHFGLKGKLVSNAASTSIPFSERIPLQAGKNVIKVSVLNEKGIESLTERFEVTYTPAQPIKPNLHVIAIGVSKFVDAEYNLTYADKDANDVSKMMKTASSMYGNITIHTLTNEQATRANVLKLRSELEKTTVDDEVVVFLASHGVLDEELDYYLAMHDMDFDSPKKGGLRYDELEGLLDAIPARNKLLLIDACHSGEVDKEESQLIASNETALAGVSSRAFKKKVTKKEGIGLANSFELMKELFADLRRNNGAVVISSASGKEYAFESSEWSNGVFTYALLEGLKTGRADLNKDKAVQVSELRDYVSKRVKDLTNGKQNPTSRTENLENDFRVW